MNKLALVALLGLSVSLSGCVISVDGDDSGAYNHLSDWENEEQQNRQQIARLNTDMSYDEVINRMGLANFNELHKSGDDTYQVLFYRTQRMKGDGLTTKEECTPLVFKNNELVGWGDKAYQSLNL